MNKAAGRRPLTEKAGGKVKRTSLRPKGPYEGISNNTMNKERAEWFEDYNMNQNYRKELSTILSQMEKDKDKDEDEDEDEGKLNILVSVMMTNRVREIAKRAIIEIGDAKKQFKPYQLPPVESTDMENIRNFNLVLTQTYPEALKKLQKSQFDALDQSNQADYQLKKLLEYSQGIGFSLDTFFTMDGKPRANPVRGKSQVKRPREEELDTRKIQGLMKTIADSSKQYAENAWMPILAPVYIEDIVNYQKTLRELHLKLEEEKRVFPRMIDTLTIGKSNPKFDKAQINSHIQTLKHYGSLKLEHGLIISLDEAKKCIDSLDVKKSTKELREKLRRDITYSEEIIGEIKNGKSKIYKYIRIILQTERERSPRNNVSLNARARSQNRHQPPRSLSPKTRERSRNRQPPPKLSPRVFTPQGGSFTLPGQ